MNLNKLIKMGLAIWLVMFLVVLAAIVGIVWVAFHFISKYW